jgi:hypothetical protein
MIKSLFISSLFILILTFNLFAGDHNYRIILQGVDYPSAAIEIIKNNIMFRPSTDFGIDKDFYDINYEMGIGYLSLDNHNFSLVPSLSYLGENYYEKYFNDTYNKEMINKFYSMGLGINIAFYWYWNHLLLGGFLPFRTIIYKNSNLYGKTSEDVLDNFNFKPTIMIGISF